MNIIINKGIVLAIVAPIKSDYEAEWLNYNIPADPEGYNAALQIAIKKGIPFNKAWQNDFFLKWFPQEGIVYAVPEGFKLMFGCDNDCHADRGDCCHPSNCGRYAYLKPIVKVDHTINSNYQDDLFWPVVEQSIEGLLPCPFCNSQPEWINETIGDGHYYIRCSNGHCHVTIKEDRRDKAIGWWNNRKSDDNYNWSDIERAYCLGLLNRKDLTIDELSKALQEAKTKLEYLKNFLKEVKKENSHE